jgi:hypothetical protein
MRNESVLRSRNSFAFPVAVPVIQRGKRAALHTIDVKSAVQVIDFVL